jgi:membrane peptidoglycan carboxypeptidase
VDLPDTTFLEIRKALIAVVEQGTARAVRLASLQLAGKTGTAQNPEGPNTGWFIGFAPADRPQIVVAGVIEGAGHGTAVAPYVARIIERYVLGPDTTEQGRGFRPVRLAVPEDTVRGVASMPVNPSPRPPAPVGPSPIRPARITPAPGGPAPAGPARTGAPTPARPARGVRPSPARPLKRAPPPNPVPIPPPPPEDTGPPPSAGLQRR